MNFTWLDSNSWLIEIGEQRILIDPWLIGDLTFNNLDWLFKGSRTQDRSIPDKIDLILLSQGLEDHAHPPTLKQLNKNIPVVASPNAAKVVKQLGYQQIINLNHGETFTLNHHIEIKAFPGSPIGPTLLENGYLLKDLANNSTLYYEPHGYHSPQLQEIAPIDVVITPIIDLSLTLLGPIIKGMNSALELVKSVKPEFILPTAAGGDIVFEGILIKFLQTRGNTAEFQTLLENNNLTTKVINPHPGEKVSVCIMEKSTIENTDKTKK
ncbi:MBL fold metallo-hydrolase [Aphanizomenon flos-aquae NRERC-008]|jgi:L-ascorbate metabolism protein UlaG (beta-lactamase superfamily)|uniref:MBL fold metallo-hydrolase n=1 Tax=Aphanizomenon flos-aquae FACHB-1249 TaxID=2692889 RepID=A0ABR8IPZ3_APHFL|nr:MULTISPECIES: MBL fold metallo-hydrolase [Aphanizomenon]MBO1059549.1 MBL fold metallo-hydrolase [Aphanizomenon flos-aquae CP01]MCE2903890.1 MBL fold metallo-hydrolase [Anabaena sp. CoA2_C59]MDJ0506428.1 MBL fold metallo-hydrolase [Nostocales cyanobacterium LE14-WE12]MBD2630263.1 MBL fold metallo-hydrolase [Aphanizomenon sp. FACHB-1399]MBD2641446.1 MBL fold metallo-hydrolase [Aphanizomenon sp. FACHB-1401]